MSRSRSTVDLTERWFVRRGLPHLIDRYSATEDVFTRMAPFLALVVFFEFFLAFGDRWTGWWQSVAFGVCLAALVTSVAVVNRIRGRRPLALPNEVGVWELALYVLLPVVPTVIGSQRSVWDNIISVIGFNLAVLALGYIVTTWGLFSMMRWSLGQVRRQINDVATLAMKTVPTLLVFSAFIFINAEMWQVANDWTLPLFGVVFGLIVGLGGVFVFVSVRRITVDLARFEAWSEVRARCGGTPVAELVPSDDDPAPDAPTLPRRAEINVSLLLFVAQGIQIVLVSFVVTVFYVIFGLLTVREDTLGQWTTATELTFERDWAVVFAVFGTDVIFTRQLLLVAAFIGLMSGLNFAVQIVTDQAYRSEFAEEMTSEVRDALAVRAVYLRRLV
ncbi:MAG: hypothetical protein ACO3PD_00560 [Acidimicrobiales bacterium]